MTGETPFLEFERYGEEHQPLVLLIPGAGAPMQFWTEEFCREVASHGFHVVRYCHRDTGRSTHYDAPYSIDVLLEDAMALRSRFANPTAHLVGHSMGGYMAQLALCRSAHAIASATAISAGPSVDFAAYAELGMTKPGNDVWPVLMANQPSGDFDADLPGWLTILRYLNGTRPFDTQMATEYTRALYVGDPRNHQIAEHHIHAMSTVPTQLVDDLARAEGKLLVIHGERDPLVPVDNGAASARLAKRGSLQVLPGAGHMFFHGEIWRDIAAALVPHLRAGT